MRELLSATRVISLILVLTAAIFCQTHTQKPSAPSASSNPFETFQSFSATLNGGVSNDHDRKIVRSGNLMRTQFEDHYRITDLTERSTWAVLEKHCAKFSAPDSGTYPFGVFRHFKTERVHSPDKETIDGHVCSIENVTFTAKGDKPAVVRMKIWEAEDLHNFPIKIDVVEADGRQFNIAYTAIDFKAPDPKLFQHPANCESQSQPPAGKGAKSTPKPVK